MPLHIFVCVIWVALASSFHLFCHHVLAAAVLRSWNMFAHPCWGQRLCHESFAELVPCDRSQLENRKGSPSCESSCSWSEAEGTECCHVQLRITSDFYISHAVMSNHHCSSFKTFSVLTLVALKKSDGNCLVTVIFHLIYHLMIIMHRTQNA